MRRLAFLFIAVVALAGTPAVAAPASPPATPEAYPPVADLRDLWIRPWTLEGEPHTLTGTVLYIEIAAPGEGLDVEMIGAPDEPTTWRTWIVLDVGIRDGWRNDAVAVVIDADVPGVYDGDTVIVRGRLVGETLVDTDTGSQVTVPLVIAAAVLPDPPPATPAT